MNHFYVGQEVACIKAHYDPNQKTTIAPELVEGQIYRIRWLGMYNHYLDGEYLGVRVEGIDRGVCPIWGYEDQPFRAERFRPLVNDPLAIFRNMVAPQDGKPFVPLAPEGPLHPDGPLPEERREREKEEVE